MQAAPCIIAEFDHFRDVGIPSVLPGGGVRTFGKAQSNDLQVPTTCVLRESERLEGRASANVALSLSNRELGGIVLRPSFRRILAND